MLGLGIASSAAQYKAQADAAQAQAKYQNELSRQTGEIAQANYIQQTGADSARIGQNAMAAGQAIQENALRTTQAEASVRTAAAEGGVAGNSVEELLGDFGRQEAIAADAIRTNQSWTTAQIIEQDKSLQAQAQGRIAAARPGPVNTPSALALGLSIAGSAFGAYDTSLRHNQLGPYDPNATPQSQGWMYRPLPLLGGLLPNRQQPRGGGTFSS